MTPIERAEEVRTALLEFLSPRQNLTFEAEAILRRLNKEKVVDFTITDDDIASAIAFLEGKAYVTHRTSGLGATRFYQATSAGVLAFERGTLE